MPDLTILFFMIIPMAVVWFVGGTFAYWFWGWLEDAPGVSFEVNNDFAQSQWISLLPKEQ